MTLNFRFTEHSVACIQLGKLRKVQLAMCYFSLMSTTCLNMGRKENVFGGISHLHVESGSRLP